MSFSEIKKFSKNIQFKNNVRNVPSEIGEKHIGGKPQDLKLGT